MNILKKFKFELMLITALFVMLICVLLTQEGLLSPAPTIIESSPSVVTLEYPETWSVKLHGANYSPDMKLYINKKEIDSYEYTDDGTLAFEIPEIFMKSQDSINASTDVSDQTEHSVLNLHLTNQAGRKSNTFHLQVQNLPRPNITSVNVKKHTKTFEMVELTMENLPRDFNVSVNGIAQTSVVKTNDHTLVLKIPTQQYLNVSSLDIVVADNTAENVRSTAYLLENKNKRDATYTLDSSIDYLKQGYLILHAFGMYNGLTYTNSRQAFEKNYKKGHRIFEVDFQFTSDGVLATLHDRNERLETFEEEQKKESYSILTFGELCDLMLEYPDIYIVTDTKYSNNFEATEAVFDYMSQVIDKKSKKLYKRFVIQIYNEYMYYLMIDHYDFKSYIYTLYATTATNEEVIDFAIREGIKAVTMPTERATEDFINLLNSVGICVFTHTNNNIAEIEELMNRGIFGVYTDAATYEDLPFDRKGKYQSWKTILSKEATLAVDTENSIISKNKVEFKLFLDRLSKIKEDYIIVISAMDEASTNVTDDIQESLYAFGLKKPIQGKYRYGYVGVVDGGEILFEECSQELITKELALEGCTLSVESAGMDTGEPHSSIRFDGIDYSMHKRGLNIAVYHKLSNKVVEAVAFDTYHDFEKYMK